MLNAAIYVAFAFAIVAIIAGSIPLFMLSCVAGSVCTLADYSRE